VCGLGACGQSGSDDDSGPHANHGGTAGATSGGASGRSAAGTAASGRAGTNGAGAGHGAVGSGGTEPGGQGGVSNPSDSAGASGAGVEPAAGASGAGAGNDGGTSGGRAAHFIDVSTGDDAACAVSDAHELYCWGYQDNSQPLVGDGTSYRRSRPVRISDHDDWTDVESGVFASCALRNGELWCWGGVDPQHFTPGYLVPTRVGTDNDWQSIGIGRSYVCGIRTGGAVWCFGSDLGFNAATDSQPTLEPQELTLRGDIGENLGFEALSVGRYGGCALRAGQIYCWGTNLSSVGVPARFGDDSDWQSISAGDKYACGIRGGNVYCWGQDDTGEVGDADAVNGSNQSYIYPPIEIQPAGGWTSVYAYTDVTCGIRQGELYCWGMGPTGFAQPYARPPTRVGTANDWTLARPGDWVSCGLRGQDLYCWGSNGSGAVGAGVAGIHAEPQLVSDGWQGVALGRLHACGLKQGQVNCFGKIPQYFLDESATPVVVTGETDWRALSAADGYTCGLRADNAFCWGTNVNGRLGTGGTDSSPSPWGVGPVGAWSAIASADDRSCGIREGELYCWGDNHLGFLGDGTLNLANAPVRIGVASDWSEIALGYQDSCGVRSGKLYCWGRNESGLVGTGDTAEVHEPIQIGTATNWTGITMGLPACGLRGGALYCWGPRGILTNADDPLTPTRVGSDSDWTVIRTYDAATCGLRHGGELYCWGADWIGQLPGTTGPSDRTDEPVRIGSLTWDDIELEYQYFCGVSSGALYCWGDNESGKLGLGAVGAIEPLRVEAAP